MEVRSQDLIQTATILSIVETDPRSPYHRKQAFDLGDAGAGSTANNLSLGCDCLGSIRYFSGWLNNEKGQPIEAPNVICMHEQVSIKNMVLGSC